MRIAQRGIDGGRAAPPRAPSGAGAGASSRARRDGRPFAVGIEEDLDLDVARTLDEALEDQPVVAERAGASRRAAASAVRRRAGVADRPHPLPATPGGRLDEHREADPVRRGGQGARRSGRRRRSPPGSGRPSSAASRRAAALSPIARIAAGGGPIQRMPGVDHALRRTRRSRRGTRSPDGRRRLLPGAAASTTPAESSRSIASGRRDRRRDSPDAKTLARAADAVRDLASVRDEQRCDVRRWLAGRLLHGHRANRVKRDTPSTSDTASGKLPARDPALDGSR